jgi:hypothetical protein
MAQFDLKNAVVRFKDGSGTPKTLDLNIGEGTVTYDERRNMEYVRNRGVLDTVREGDEEPMDVRLDLKWEFLKSNTTTNPTAEDALKQRGGAADWVSSDTDTCAPYAVDIEIWYDPKCATEDTEDIILPDFRWESISHDADAGTIAVTGRCNATQALSTRAAQT